MAAPQISVIIQFLNSEKYLRDAIRSVLWQTFTDWELVLVDGGSSDQSPTIAAEIARRDSDRVRFFHHQGPTTLGIFSSRIWGAREARAPLLAHLDSDDEWHPRFLESHYLIHRTYFKERPGFVYSPMVYWYENAKRAFDCHVQPLPLPGLHEPPALVLPFIEDQYSRTPGNSAVMVNRDIIVSAAKLIGTAEEGVCDDQFLWSFIASQYPICVYPEPLCRYRRWSGSTCASAGKKEERRARQSHLGWLETYLTSEYKGADRDGLLLALRAGKNANH